MNTKKETVIIGGGPAGLMCALIAGLNGKKVTILEADVKVGKKILVSGNGRCNLTNLSNLENAYNQNVMKYLIRLDAVETVKFFNFLGLETMRDEESRMYPITNMSISVLDTILNHLELLKTEIITQTKVESVVKSKDEYKLITNNGEYTAKNVVLATGGNSAKEILDSLNIKTKPCIPSLCALKVKENVQELSGIRIPNAVASVLINGKEHKQFGEVLFKDEGVSGICIFNLSAEMARKNIDSTRLSINIFPEYSKKGLVDLLLNRKNTLLNLPAHKFFCGLTHKNIGNEVLKRANISRNDAVSTFNFEHLEKIAETLQNLQFEVNGKYDNAQVHSGGVMLSELNHNLEVKDHPQFYVCGEVVDVDGLCGGYNMQWAWTSGSIVGESLK